MLKNGIHVCFNFISLYLRINMDKTSQKVTKDPKCVEVACKGRKNYMNKLKESILNDANKGGGDTSNASNETNSSVNTASPLSPALPATLPQDPVIIMSMALVYLLSCHEALRIFCI